MPSGFSTPIDYLGLDGTPLKLKASSENKTAKEKAAVGIHGDVVARDVYGEVATPSCDFEVIAAGNLSLSLGSVNTESGVVYVLTGGQITAKAGEPHKVTLRGESLQSGATVSSTIATGAIALIKLHKAVALGACGTVGGTGCNLQECALEISSTLGRATVAGATVAHDIFGGKLSAKLTIEQTEDTPPTFTAAAGWEITEPLSTENPDEDYPKWTVTCVKDLTTADPV